MEVRHKQVRQASVMAYKSKLSAFETQMLFENILRIPKLRAEHMAQQCCVGCVEVGRWHLELAELKCDMLQKRGLFAKVFSV